MKNASEWLIKSVLTRAKFSDTKKRTATKTINPIT